MYSLTNRVGLLSTMPIVGFDENKRHKKAERQYRYARFLHRFLHGFLHRLLDGFLYSIPTHCS